MSNPSIRIKHDRRQPAYRFMVVVDSGESVESFSPEGLEIFRPWKQDAEGLVKLLEKSLADLGLEAVVSWEVDESELPGSRS